MDEDEAIQKDLLLGMVEASKTRKRVVKRFRTLTFDRETLDQLGVSERKWRVRRVPRDAETRSLLLTGYLGLVVRLEPFTSWRDICARRFQASNWSRVALWPFSCNSLNSGIYSV